MHVSKGVSDKLQSEDLDVVTGCERVAVLLTTLRGLRSVHEYLCMSFFRINTCKTLDKGKGE
jgi:hypothetical protein